MLSIIICKCLVLNFPPLEVVSRCSETQLEVGENLNDLIHHIKGKYRQ